MSGTSVHQLASTTELSPTTISTCSDDITAINKKKAIKNILLAKEEVIVTNGKQVPKGQFKSNLPPTAVKSKTKKTNSNNINEQGKREAVHDLSGALEDQTTDPMKKQRIGKNKEKKVTSTEKVFETSKTVVTASLVIENDSEE